MKLINGKKLYTRAEVLDKISRNAHKFRFETGDVFKCYMSYDNDPNTFEERWCVIIDADSSEVLIVEGTGTENNNYLYYEVKFWSFAGFLEKTYIRTDQAIKISEKFFTGKHGHLIQLDMDALANIIENNSLKIRNN